MSERIPAGLNSIGANYPGQTGRITVHYNGKTYFADLEDGCAVLDLASEEEATAASRYDAPEPRQWTTRHAGVDLMVTLHEDGTLEVAPRRGPSSWDAPLVVTEATS